MPVLPPQIEVISSWKFRVFYIRQGKLNSQFITARMLFQSFPKIFRFQIYYCKQYNWPHPLVFVSVATAIARIFDLKFQLTNDYQSKSRSLVACLLILYINWSIDYRATYVGSSIIYDWRLLIMVYVLIWNLNNDRPPTCKSKYVVTIIKLWI